MPVETYGHIKKYIILVNQDTGAALINLGGFIIDFIPGVGSAGDAAKALPKLVKFISKYSDDAPKVLEAIIRVTKLFPDYDLVPALAKAIAASSLDDVVDSIKSGDKITKADYTNLCNVLEAAGKNADEALGFIAKNADEINFKPQSLIDELASSEKNSHWKMLNLL